MFLSMMILLFLNILLLMSVLSNQKSPSDGWKVAEQIGGALQESESGELRLPEKEKKLLEDRDTWALLVQDGTGKVIWHSENLPEGVPLQYSLADLAWAVRGYIADYPVTTGERGRDLILLGNPKTMYWKSMWNTFDYHLIASAPKLLLLFLGVNAAAIALIYLTAVSGVLRAVKPIVKGIESLTENKETYVKENGLLVDLAKALNLVSEKLQSQERILKKKEQARANWISGVSHDIRTPLSMVMGYAGQLEDNPELPKEERKKASIIRMQSVKMKNLINDLNLASKLEYNMQPLRMEQINVVAVARKAVADAVNLDLEGRYQIEWNTEEELTVCMINGDKDLLLRAVNNLITNAQVHNPEGCTIQVEVRVLQGTAQIRIEDNGAGVTEEQLKRLKEMPHYMMSDKSTLEQRHGLGLLIVRQIAAVHHGAVEFVSEPERGFEAEIRLPVIGYNSQP